jgi:hypothetical protein
MSIIAATDIIIHDHSVGVPFPESLVECEHFGIIKIKMNKVKMTTKPLFLLFTIDTTGSMNETTKGKSTKMDYVKQTFTSMLTYLSNIDVEIYIKVNTFNINAVIAIETMRLTKDNLDNLLVIIHQLYADGSTDIGVALQSAKGSMVDYIAANPEHEVAHIFMTDGEATVGEKSPSILCDFIDESYSNIFVGFGFDHNAPAMRKFGEKKLADYQFVDNMENTALIYGETIHRFLYPAIKDIRIDIEEGCVYNWRTNEWTHQITEDVYVGEIEKIYHIKTMNVADVCAKLYGKICGIQYDFVGNFTFSSDIELLDTIYVMPSLIAIETGEIQSNEEDLTKYLYRQRVQELLYSAKTSTRESIADIKINLKNCFRVLHRYMRTENLLEDAFLKQLCDDIYIIWRTIGTRVGEMYSTSRQATQGMQRSYTGSSQVPTEHTPRLRMMRQTTGIIHNNIIRSNGMDEFDDFHTLPPPPLELDIDALGDPRQFNAVDGSLFNENDDDIESYVSIETNVSCYSTPTVVNTMRSVSSGRADVV